MSTPFDESYIDFGSLPKVTDLAEVKKSLCSDLSKLSQYSVDDLITFFSIASKSGFPWTVLAT